MISELENSMIPFSCMHNTVQSIHLCKHIAWFGKTSTVYAGNYIQELAFIIAIINSTIFNELLDHALLNSTCRIQCIMKH